MARLRQKLKVKKASNTKAKYTAKYTYKKITKNTGAKKYSYVTKAKSIIKKYAYK